MSAETAGRKPRITLQAWGAAQFDPPPSDWTLRKMARDGLIYPAPMKLGRTYYVDQSARVVDPSAPRLSLVQRLELEAQSA